MVPATIAVAEAAVAVEGTVVGRAWAMGVVAVLEVVGVAAAELAGAVEVTADPAS